VGFATTSNEFRLIGLAISSLYAFPPVDPLLKCDWSDAGETVAADDVSDFVLGGADGAADDARADPGDQGGELHGLLSDLWVGDGRG